MSLVEALSFDEQEVGRKIAETKKRFKWRFRIGSRSYLMELVNSALSGKRIVLLDGMELYNEQSVTNFDFEYNRVIDGHTFRITRMEDMINKFELRVDNCSFEEMLENKHTQSREPKVSKYAKEESDPFAEFGSFAAASKPSSNQNDFGDFDMDSFAQPAVSAPNKENKGKTDAAPLVIGSGKAGTYQEVNFQTNTFQTNNFGNFADSFKKAETNLLGEDNFATNTYGQNNLYNDLLNMKIEERSELYDEDFLKKEQQKEKGAFDNFGFDMTAKQAVNKMKRAVETVKNKVNGYDDSLI